MLRIDPYFKPRSRLKLFCYQIVGNRNNQPNACCLIGYSTDLDSGNWLHVCCFIKRHFLKGCCMGNTINQYFDLDLRPRFVAKLRLRLKGSSGKNQGFGWVLIRDDLGKQIDGFKMVPRCCCFSSVTKKLDYFIFIYFLCFYTKIIQGGSMWSLHTHSCNHANGVFIYWGCYQSSHKAERGLFTI